MSRKCDADICIIRTAEIPPVMAIQGHCLNNGSASLWLSYTTKRGKFTNFLLYNKFFLKKSDISSYS